MNFVLIIVIGALLAIVIHQHWYEKRLRLELLKVWQCITITSLVQESFMSILSEDQSKATDEYFEKRMEELKQQQST